MTKWTCERCGYLALSSPYEDFITESGQEATDTHRCPNCGEQSWLPYGPGLPGKTSERAVIRKQRRDSFLSRGKDG